MLCIYDVETTGVSSDARMVCGCVLQLPAFRVHVFGEAHAKAMIGLLRCGHRLGFNNARFDDRILRNYGKLGDENCLDLYREITAVNGHRKGWRMDDIVTAMMPNARHGNAPSISGADVPALAQSPAGMVSVIAHCLDDVYNLYALARAIVLQRGQVRTRAGRLRLRTPFVNALRGLLRMDGLFRLESSDLAEPAPAEPAPDGPGDEDQSREMF